MLRFGVTPRMSRRPRSIAAQDSPSCSRPSRNQHRARATGSGGRSARSPPSSRSGRRPRSVLSKGDISHSSFGSPVITGRTRSNRPKLSGERSDMVESPAPSVSERDVFFEPPHYSPDEIEAVLSDGTHIKSEYQLDGTRLGFARPLPVGTRILLTGILGWVVGSTPTEHQNEPVS